MDKKSCDMDKKGMTMGKAILKLSAYVNCGMLTVHILKARHLYATENPHCHPYVQVCLAPDTSGGTKCCTAVTQNSPHATFNEKFSFELLLPTDSRRRLHVSVWNCQASESSPPEFLGSMSFGLNSLLSKNKEIGGWYYLLREDIGKKKHLPAVLRTGVYGDVGSPLLQSPDCPETPLLEPKHTRVSQAPHTQTSVVADVMVHRDFNGNSTDTTQAKCLECPLPLRASCDEGHYFDKVAAPNGGLVQSFHSSFRLGRRKDHHAQTQLTMSNMSPIVSSKHVRFSTSQGKQIASGNNNINNGFPKDLPAPEKSALKSPLMKRSQNPFVLQYRQEIASVEKKVLLNSQKAADVGEVSQKDGENGNTMSVDKVVQEISTPPDIIRAEDASVITNNTKDRLEIDGVSKAESITTTNTPVSVMGYPSQFREECLKATSESSPFPKQSSSVSSSSAIKPEGCNGEIWIDCQSLESTNTTQDSGICDSSSPKSEDNRHQCHGKYQETSFCNGTDTNKNPGKVSVYKDSHLEPSVKCKVDLMQKYAEKQVIPPATCGGATSSSQVPSRSKLASASFCGGSSSPYSGCESCAVKYYRQLYSPVLGETTHTKIYFL